MLRSNCHKNWNTFELVVWSGTHTAKPTVSTGCFSTPPIFPPHGCFFYTCLFLYNNVLLVILLPVSKKSFKNWQLFICYGSYCHSVPLMQIIQLLSNTESCSALNTVFTHTFNNNHLYLITVLMDARSYSTVALVFGSGLSAFWTLVNRQHSG